MNWKLVLLLSLSGPMLAIAGVYGLISFGIEPYVMSTVLIIFAILIAKFGKQYYFLQGMLAGLLSGFLMTVVRLRFLQKYVQNNQDAIDQVEFILHKLKFIRSPLIILSLFIITASLLTGLISFGLSRILNKD